MTSNILGTLPNLETLAEEFHEFRNEFTSKKRNEREQTDELKRNFLEEIPLSIQLYLLDDFQLVNANGNITSTYANIHEPSNKDTELTKKLFSVEPGKDDYHGNWQTARGSELVINNKNQGQIAYAHTSNKNIKDLVNNLHRQEKVLRKTMQNAQTYLHEKIMEYDASNLSPQDIEERAESLRGLMGAITQTYSTASNNLRRNQQNIWTQL